MTSPPSFISQPSIIGLPLASTRHRQRIVAGMPGRGGLFKLWA
jgi:uncharacterized protein (DUF779 family)